jgi:hypothetical protein
VLSKPNQDRRPQLSPFMQLLNHLSGWATPATGAFLNGRAFDPTQGTPRLL